LANYKKNLYKRDYQRLILILVLEAVVAAPVWIAAHAMPEGEGIAGEHGRRGYMMLINILLRPSLMVIGFFLSIVLISAFSKVALIILGIRNLVLICKNNTSRLSYVKMNFSVDCIV